MLQLVFLLTFPLLLSIGAAYLTWNALSSPWKFLIISICALYLLYVASFYLLAPQSVGFTLRAVEPGQTNQDEPLFVYLEPYYKSIAAFAVASIPTIFALLRIFKRQANQQRD